MSYENYFGHSNADDEVNLKDFFYRSSLFEQLKKRNRATGKFVVHGIKGAGKTAICNMIQQQNTAELVCKIDKSFGFDVTGLGKYAAPIEGLVLSLLLKEMINEIRSRRSEFKNPESVQRVDNSVEQLKSFFKRVLQGVKFGVGPIDIDVEKIMASKLSGFTRFRIGDYVEMLRPALKEKMGYILIDDVDDVFIGAESSSAFIEGLLRAAKEINRSFGELLHCIVFLKSGIFKLFVENAKEYDKLRDFIVSMSWGGNELVELLSRRIIAIHRHQERLADWQVWQLDFKGETQKDIERIQDFLVRRCVCGPRDLIFYCNLAKEAAGAERIGLNVIEDVEDRFSQDKLTGINRDFGGTYPRISDLLQQGFAGQLQKYSNAELMKLLNDKIITNSHIQEIFDYDYVRFATKENLVELLYTIGFLGFRRTKNSTIEFVMTNPEPGPKVLYTAQEYEIHEAYRQYLNLS